MIRLSLVGVRVEVPTNQPIVLLREDEGTRFLPIFIGSPGGDRDRLRAPGHGDAPADDPRPLQDRARRPSVQARPGRDHRAARRHLLRRDRVRPRTAPSRGSRPGPPTPSRWPSASAPTVPIFADEDVLDEAGVLFEADDEDEEQIEQFREFLDQVTPRGLRRTARPPDPDDLGRRRHDGATERHGSRHTPRNYDRVLQRAPPVVDVQIDGVDGRTQSPAGVRAAMLDGREPTPASRLPRPAGLQDRRHHLPPARLLGAHRSRPAVGHATRKGSGTQRLYSYRDLVELKVIKSLLDAGISLQTARKAIEYLRDDLGEDLASARTRARRRRTSVLAQHRRADRRPRARRPGRAQHRPARGRVAELDAEAVQLASRADARRDSARGRGDGGRRAIIDAEPLPHEQRPLRAQLRATVREAARLLRHRVGVRAAHVHARARPRRPARCRRSRPTSTSRRTTSTSRSRRSTRSWSPRRTARRAGCVELHPEVAIKVLYQRDYLHLLVKYGLEPPSQLVDGDRRRADARRRLPLDLGRRAALGRAASAAAESA